jgi:hypothetical protein
MADSSPSDGAQLYPLPPEVCAHIFTFLPTADLRYVALATTVFRDLAYYELEQRARRRPPDIPGLDRLKKPLYRGVVYPCCAGVRANGTPVYKWPIRTTATSLARFIDRSRDLGVPLGFAPNQLMRIAEVAVASGAVDLLDHLDMTARTSIECPPAPSQRRAYADCRSVWADGRVHVARLRV